MDTVLQIENVYWSRNQELILENMNWHVNNGDHWAVLGLNGSGKTTLLNMVMGYIWPTSGQISVLGHTYGKVDIQQVRQSIGWVSSSFQEKIRPYERVQDIIVSGKYASIGLYEEPSTDDIEEANEWLEQFHLTQLQNETYQTCSQGEKQKILIARALMAHPKLLILDEPTTGLDFVSREQLLDSIARISKQKEAPTIIFVTHYIEEIIPIFNKSLLIKDGTVFKSGNTSELLTSETLTDFFGITVEVDRYSKRMSLKKTY
ncbi:ABC transporter ATP-binding protein [Cytobacillus kochii]|uniref:ABC transporter ATP-binding protein n=1 Tax=Cytobacillus kochii TaxID=859143 RepID=UPI002E1F0EDB|nr:ABC transporter ATP-binding protein [Cytobacillus kochii]